MRFSNARDWDSHSRARFGRALLLPKSCPSLCHRARVAVCGVFVCRRCVLRVSNGLPARSGATRAAKPPKTERGAFRLSKLAEKLPRSVFRLRRASPPPLGHCPAFAGRGGQSPRWWCCEGRRCRGRLTQKCRVWIFIAASASRDRCAPYGFAYGEVSLASLGAFPLAHYDIIQTMKHALLASKSITLKAPQAKVRRIKAVIGNLS